MSIVVRMRKDGRVIIPHAYRRLYNLHEGDIVEIEIIRVKYAEDGRVVDFSDAIAPAPERGAVSDA